ncbi:hypothetical protein J1N35_041816 [Gossypium stocksii]|uniref:Uncharacterized protein n=1 Tax=Gossypium stocksii TaxID=47602 RepID=A0A9D3UI62_9ROSI|nr:hypothetical protein J1N35_041816 [Gossypium stocksii]
MNKLANSILKFVVIWRNPFSFSSVTDRMIKKAAEIFAVAANEIKTNVPNSIPIQWRKLKPGFVKINTDGSAFGNPG